ncbi:hypothetical protein EGI22_02970 [Lacihabitans sp. LS3-19]|uniref:beta strand repeat-containing protein n=1 Tax=Lacihabitans sp. LS3-19 TaxID=2487335 RepID=UPI0020CC84B3|nr:hypothetical protein [Lacihabitans sp. LS3-19]MCP9766854.1 hypothetical protein [Lacihabitans sp. LS3-19]
MKKNLLLIFILGNYLSVYSQTWTGAINTLWNEPGNWNTSILPVATSNVTIPGSLSNYPVLQADVTINSINMASGSVIDFNGKKLTINSVNAYNYFTGATLNNTLAATDIVIDLDLGVGGYYTVVHNNTINDNITFNLSGTNTFYEANTVSTQNTFLGDVNYLVNGSSILDIGNGSKSTYSGNVSIVRMSAGSSTIFGAGATISGNFSFNNSTSGSTSLGNQNIKTAIGGKVDITVLNSSTSPFALYHFVNQTSGGAIAVQNSLGFDIINDTLQINSIVITDFKGSNYSNLKTNLITGNVTIADDPSYGGGYYTTIQKNEIGGTASFTNNGSNIFYEANSPNTQNLFSGNVSYTANGSGTIEIGNSAKSIYGGNVTINRTASGASFIFGHGAVINGDFSFTNLTAGSSYFGELTNKTSIAGKVDITINNSTTSNFFINHFVNQTAGGVISIQNTIGFGVQYDTLMVNSISITDYKGSQYSNFRNNKISGNLILADDATYGGGYYTTIYNNEIGGTAIFTNNGTNAFYDANTANTANKYSGNVSYTANGSGALDIGNGSKSTYGGNVNITRTAAGTSTIFGAGATITGNFLFTNPTSGSTVLGNLSNKTDIGGKVDITVTNILTSSFYLYRFVNQTAGGIIAIQNSLGFEVLNDTLLVNSLSVTDYTGSQYAKLNYNKISGDVTIADHASYGGGYYTTIYKNEIGGTASFTNKGTNTFYDANTANTANKYLGDVIYTKIGGILDISSGAENEYGKGITLNSASGINLVNVKFIGSSDGVFEQLGTQAFIIPNIKLEKTGAGKITLNNQLTIGNSIAFTSGYLIATVGKELIFPDNIGYTGASDASYIEGSAIKIGNDAFVFPLGGEGKLAKISISAPSSVTDEFTASYFNNAPGNSTLKEVTLDHLSLNEVWLLAQTTGSSSVLVSLSWETARSGIIDNLSDLRISSYVNGSWVDNGNGGTTGTNLSGDIVTAAPLNASGLFTLASATSSNSFLPIFETIITGNWNNGGTWIAPTNPVVPTAKKIAKINASHTVSIPNTGNTIKTIQMNGGELNLTGGTLEIKNQ